MLCAHCQSGPSVPRQEMPIVRPSDVRAAGQFPGFFVCAGQSPLKARGGAWLTAQLGREGSYLFVEYGCQFFCKCSFCRLYPKFFSVLLRSTFILKICSCVRFVHVELKMFLQGKLSPSYDGRRWGGTSQCLLNFHMRGRCLSVVKPRFCVLVLTLLMGWTCCGFSLAGSGVRVGGEAVRTTFPKPGGPQRSLQSLP